MMNNVVYNSIVGEVWNGLWDDLTSLDWWAVLIWALVVVVGAIVLWSAYHRSNAHVGGSVSKKGIHTKVNVSSRLSWEVITIYTILAGVVYVLIAVCL